MNIYVNIFNFSITFGVCLIEFIGLTASFVGGKKN